MIAAILDFVSIGAVPFAATALANPERAFQMATDSPASSFMSIDSPTQMLIYGGIALLFLFGVRSIFQICLLYFQAHAVQNQFSRITTDLFRLYLSAPYAYHLMHNSSDLSRKVQFETQRTALAVVLPAMNMCLASLFVIALSLLVIVSEPILGTAAIAFLACVVFVYLRQFQKRASLHGKGQSSSVSHLLRTSNEALAAIKDIKVRGTESYFVDEMETGAKFRARALQFQTFSNQVSKPLIEGVAVAGLVAYVFLVMVQGRSIDETIPTIALLGAVMVRMLPSLNQFSSGHIAIGNNIFALEEILNDFDALRSQTTDSTAGDGEIKFEHSIEFQHLSFSYPQTNGRVLNDITLTIAKGSSVAFVGPTGAGKTTIVDVVLGLLVPQAGKILVDSKDIFLHLPSWQRQIGYIAQVIHLFEGSIRSNIALGVPAEEIDDQRVWEVLEIAQLAMFVRSSPQQLDTEIGERGIRLSGGQRQRIGIARALYHDPEVLVLDEATAAVDNTTEKQMMEALKIAQTDRTVIMIAHRLSTVQDCDVIYYIDAGEVVDAGSYSDLLSRNADFRRLAQQGEHSD